MTKEQFLLAITKKERGKYITILDLFVDEKRMLYSTKELYVLLVNQFALDPQEKSKFSYWGFNRAFKSYKQRMKGTKMRQQAGQILNIPVASPPPDEPGWSFTDADELSDTSRKEKYKNL